MLFPAKHYVFFVSICWGSSSQQAAGKHVFLPKVPSITEFLTHLGITTGVDFICAGGGHFLLVQC